MFPQRQPVLLQFETKKKAMKQIAKLPKVHPVYADRSLILLEPYHKETTNGRVPACLCLVPREQTVWGFTHYLRCRLQYGDSEALFLHSVDDVPLIHYSETIGHVYEHFKIPKKRYLHLYYTPKGASLDVLSNVDGMNGVLNVVSAHEDKVVSAHEDKVVSAHEGKVVNGIVSPPPPMESTSNNSDKF